MKRNFQCLIFFIGNILDFGSPFFWGHCFEFQFFLIALFFKNYSLLLFFLIGFQHFSIFLSFFTHAVHSLRKGRLNFDLVHLIFIMFSIFRFFYKLSKTCVRLVFIIKLFFFIGKLFLSFKDFILIGFLRPHAFFFSSVYFFR